MPEYDAVHSQSPETYLFLGVQIKILLSHRQTGGQFTLAEGIVPPGGDGGLHVHDREDETMHLLEGALEVTIGPRLLTLNAGESYFAPRTVPHRLRNLGAVPARSILVTTPGGFDRFITRAGMKIEAGAPLPEFAPPTPEQIGRLMTLAAEAGIRILAPPGK